jgi:hypothetical protein
MTKTPRELAFLGVFAVSVCGPFGALRVSWTLGNVAH